MGGSYNELCQQVIGHCSVALRQLPPAVAPIIDPAELAPPAEHRAAATGASRSSDGRAVTSSRHAVVAFQFPAARASTAAFHALLKIRWAVAGDTLELVVPSLTLPASSSRLFAL